MSARGRDDLRLEQAETALPPQARQDLEILHDAPVSVTANPGEHFFPDEQPLIAEKRSEYCRAQIHSLRDESRKPARIVEPESKRATHDTGVRQRRLHNHRSIS